MSKLIVVSAPSGAGKTTLCERLLAYFPELRLSISSTTRAPRGNEKHGVHYFFLSREQFESEIAQNCFAEWASVHGNYYGTSKKFIEENLNKKTPVLLDIDVQGAESLRNSFPAITQSIFIAPPSLQVLEARLRARGTDSEETIQKRMKNAAHEMTQSKGFHFEIVNDDLERAFSRLKEIVEPIIRPKVLK